MQTAVQGFLRYLQLERNASELTLKSYREDLNSFTDFLQDRVGSIPAAEQVDIPMLRAFVAYLHECNYARTTIARRLACLRSLFRYTTREGITESNPAKSAIRRLRPTALAVAAAIMVAWKRWQVGQQSRRKECASC